MRNPLVSVIIPVYNGEHYLAEAIKSVLSQTHNPLEIIVVDDGSTDRSSDIAKSFKAISYIYQPNQGVAVARNVGIAAAHGELVAFIDADDLWKSEKLCLQVSELRDHPKTDFCICLYQNFLEPRINPPAGSSRDFFIKSHAGYIPSALVTRYAVFKKVGLFDPSFRLGEDFDWFARAKEARIRMQIIPKILLKKRYHANNLSNQAFRDKTHLIRIFRGSIKRRLKSAPSQDN